MDIKTQNLKHIQVVGRKHIINKDHDVIQKILMKPKLLRDMIRV